MTKNAPQYRRCLRAQEVLVADSRFLKMSLLSRKQQQQQHLVLLSSSSFSEASTLGLSHISLLKAAAAPMSFFQNCIAGFDTKKVEEKNALLVSRRLFCCLRRKCEFWTTLRSAYLASN
jgi:hypothetical protein